MSTEFLDAVKKGDHALVERLLEADPSVAPTRDESGTSALLLAHYYGHPELAPRIVAALPGLDLREAAAVGDAGRVRELAKADPASVNAYGDDGFFALGLAAFFKRPDAARALLEAGADPNLASRPAGFTPLHSAVADDEGPAVKDLVRMLLDAGADPNAQSASGGTPLHTAAFTGNIPVIQMLLAAGGDPGIADAKSHTPLDVARERRHSEAAALLHHRVTDRKRI